MTLTNVKLIFGNKRCIPRSSTSDFVAAEGCHMRGRCSWRSRVNKKEGQEIAINNC